MANAVQMHDVTKLYMLGKISSRYFYTEVARLLRRLNPCNQHETSHSMKIRALDNLSLAIREGEAVGIIGKNGSGKSTLLKLLAGVTLPTYGSIDVYGQISSLLDIGVGFQSDLSVRENVYLNGAILGMKRNKLQEQFESIIEFSEIGKFIDTPVKRLSSGMYIRLAFSIAIHCKSDILLVDEILAAADRDFLKKCRNRISEYVSSGMTLLIVSHNLGTIEELCPRTILLAQGRVAEDGKTEDVVRRYRN